MYVYSFFDTKERWVFRKKIISCILLCQSEISEDICFYICTKLDKARQNFSYLGHTCKFRLELFTVFSVCFINSRTAIAGAIIGLLLVFLFRRRDFCYDHMTSQPLQICFLFIHSCKFY